MSSTFYWNMCLQHLDEGDYYTTVNSDPSNIIKGRVDAFAEKYKDMLTANEYDFLKNEQCKISNFYMLPKLHKSKDINTIVEHKRTEYIHVNEEEVTDLQGRPINSGPTYFTRGLSIMVHKILQPCLEHIPYVLKDTYDFQTKFPQSATEDTTFVTWDIKSLYTNISHQLFYDAVSYWIDKLKTNIPLLARFSKEFIIEALLVILEFNYFQINRIFYRQCIGTAMGTPAAVVGSNLVVAYLEIRMFRLLPQLYPTDFVDFVIRSYFRFLDDLIHKWLTYFNIDEMYALLNSLDSNLKFILSGMSRSEPYLDIQISVKDDNVVFDMYYKPTNAFNYVKYSSCHPKHTRNNIALSLARRIVKMVSVSAEQQGARVDELKSHLIRRDFPESVIEETLSKVYSPPTAPKIDDPIVFNQVYNPNHKINLNRITKCLDDLTQIPMMQAFRNKKPLTTTRQAANLRRLLVKARFELSPVPREPELFGFYPCGNCTYCNKGYVRHATEFTLLHRSKPITWRYTRYFTCESRNILYVVFCNFCVDNYLGKTDFTKQRLSKHASDVRNPHNSKCRKASTHFGRCSGMVEPYFTMFPFYYADDKGLRHHLEKRFIFKWKPSLNGRI